MRVYGDPGRVRCVGESLEEIRALLQGRATTDAVRRALIEAGRVEQGLSDVGEMDAGAALTDAAAEMLLHGAAEVETVRIAIEQMQPWAARKVLMKVPEGFSFYGLFPEQYARAAEQWAADVERSGAPRGAWVVGIRSIGTTLSAIVAAALRRRGWTVRRITVRPAGHPFDRQASVPPTDADRSAWGLVVDEGPGRSGSSFAAVGRALVDAGIARERVVLFPGHAGMPGDCGSDEVMTWWRQTQRVIGPIEEVRWQGAGLYDILRAASARELACSAETLAREDLSGGAWRAFVGSDAPAWAAFERWKLRFAAPDRRSVLWKFAGLDGGAESAANMLRQRARWTSPCIGTLAGFVGMHWVDGRVLRCTDINAALIAHIGAYIAGVATVLQDAPAAVARLAEMAETNIREALGKAPAERFARQTRMLLPRLHNEHRAYGDGRLAPWEWVQQLDGRVIKVDAQGHAVDHTCVGTQSIAWDTAGAAVEWQMPPDATAALLHHAGLIDQEVHRWHAIAYAAFRLGMCAMAGIDDAPYRRTIHAHLQPATSTPAA